MSDERNARSISEELVAACPPPFSLIAYFIAYLFGRPLAYLFGRYICWLYNSACTFTHDFTLH